MPKRLIPGLALTTALLIAAVQHPPSAQSAAPSALRLVTGAGDGGGSHVQVFDVPTATNIPGTPGSFFAYTSNFKGSVRVASCDFNRDGIPDIVTGAGPGGGPHVRVLDGTTGAEMSGLLSSFYAYDPSYAGGVFVACADVTGDGIPEVITGPDAQGPQPNVRVFDLTTGAQVPSPIGSFFAYDPSFGGGVRVAGCDFNGDGRADIVTGAGPGGGSRVRVFDGATGAQLSSPIGSFSAYTPNFMGGVFVACADMNGDQVPDIITGADEGGSPHVRMFDGVTGTEIPGPLGSFFAYAPSFAGGVRVAACDVTGDGRADLVTAAGPGGGPHVQIFDGVTGNHLSSVMGSFYAYSPLFAGGVFAACPAAGTSSTCTPPTVSSSVTPVPAGTVGVPYGPITFTQNGAGPVTWSTSGTPPPGLTLSATTDALSGTPTQSGTFPFKVTATTTGSCSGSLDVSIVIAAGPNHAPSFTLPSTIRTSIKDSGPQTVPNWITNISPGPADESAQIVTFSVTGNTNTALFSSAPAISSTGTLIYTSAANAIGTATITIVAHDNGGTALGGVDTSAPQSFTINVTEPPAALRLVTGAGQGGGPHVQVFDVPAAANVPGTVGSFYAYAPNFPGGVRVASCDFNRDGVPDIVTGAGPGGGPHLRVLDGTTGVEMSGLLSSFYAYDPSYAGGVFVACGDVTGDGIPEVITGTDVAGPPQVRVFDLTTGSQVPGSIGSFMAYDAGFGGGVRVASCDFNGDGRADIVTGAGPGGESRVRVFDGATGAQLSSPIGSFSAYTPNFAGGVFVACADMNGDQVPDIITGAGEGGGPHVRMFDGVTGAEIPGPLGSFFAYSPTFAGGVRVAACDVTGDGRADLVTAAGPGGSPHVQIFDGVTGGHLPGLMGSFYAYTPLFAGGVFVGCPTEGQSPSRVVSTTPADGATNVPVDSNLAVTFLGPVNVTPGAFVLECPAGSPISLTTLTASPASTFTLDPVTDMPPSTLCRLTVVGSHVTDVPHITAAGAHPPDAVRADFTISFTTSSCSTPLVVSSSVTPVPGGTLTAPYGPVTFMQNGASPVTWSTTGTLPPGLTLSATTGDLSGTPTQSGTFPFKVTATNVSCSGSLDVTIPIAAGPNHAPSFTLASTVRTDLEDSGPHTVPGWVTNISPGPVEESAQIVTFNVTGNTNPALFRGAPAISLTGTLTYTAAANANGTATITIVARDNGGTALGGVDSSAPQSFTINVTAVNDAPSFTVGPNQTVPQNSGAQTVNPWATAISAGPADEAAQTLTFIVTNNTNPALFSAGPSVSSTGVLTYTSAPGVSGIATITLTLHDNGGTANGGVDTSAPQTFSITVTPPNTAPSFTAGPNQTVIENAGPQTVPGWATGISPGPPTEAGQTVAFIVTGNTNLALFSAAPAVSPTGTLTYTPALNAIGFATITLVLRDNGGTANGGVDTSAPQTFTITVSGPPTFTSANAAAFSIGITGTFTVTTIGSPAATLAVTSGTLPSGITFTDNGNGTATLAGPPSVNTEGTYPLTITATNVVGATPQAFTLTVNSSSTPIITNANSATFNVGALESFTFTTAASPVAGSITETGALPAGLTFANNGNGTATLSGRPAAGTAGVHPLTITASNGGPVTPQAFTLTLAPVADGAPTITSANTTTFVVSTSSTFTITTTGSVPPHVVFAGALPSGINFTDNGDGTATISGTAAAGAAGLYPLTFTASNGIPSDAVQNFTLNVNNATATPLFTSAPSSAFTIGAAGTFSITTAATPAVTTITRVGTLPAGVNFVDNHDGSATLSGTPAANSAGLYPLTLTAAGTTQSLSLKVLETAAITSANNATFTVGTAGPAFTVTTRGAPTPAVTHTGLPSGVTFVDNGDGTGTLSGTPAAGTGGPHTVTLTATNGVGTAGTQTFTLNINDPGRLTSANSTAFTVGQNGNFLVTTQAFPSAGTITRSGAALPTGVSFNDHGDGTATMSGTPAAGTGGTYALTFTFNNGVAGGPATQNFTLTVNQPPLFTSANSTTFTVGIAATPFTVTASGFPAPSIAQTGGALPTGATYTSATHQIAGTPTQTGAFPLVFTASNGVVPDATQNFTLTVACPAITVNPSTLLDGLFNTAYGPITFTQTGSTGSSFTWSATGLPTGISIAPTTGVVSGNPSNTVLNSPVAITVTDNFGCTGVRNTTITVRPNAVGDTFGNAVGNTQLAVGAVGTLPPTPTAVLSGNVKTNDSGPATLSVAFAGTSVNGGTIAEGATDGSFFYTPPANFAGASDTFTYTLTDGNGVTNTAVVTINFLNRVWYVNSAAGVNGDGRSNSPFNNLSNAQSPSLSGDIVYVHTGGATTPGNIAMDANSTLQGAGGAVSLNGGALVIPAGTPPTLTGTVTLADNTAIKNVNFTPGAVPAIAASNLAATQAILIDSVSVSGGTNALSLTNVTGANTLTVSNSTFTNTSGAAVLVSQGTMPLSIGANITQATAARAIDIQNRTGGTVTFGGAISATGNSTGIFLNGNTGGSFAFSGGVTLNGANSTFTATSSGTLTITGTNTIGGTTAPTGPALNVANTTIGASGLTFQKISATGGASGIVLNNTGANAGLTVTGSGSANSGGTIQASTGAGISLTSTRSPSFDRMQIFNTGDAGVSGTTVTNFTFTNGSIDNSGTALAPEVANIAFNTQSAGTENNLAGAITITSNTLTNAYYHGIDIFNFNGTISNATISNNTITSSVNGGSIACSATPTPTTCSKGTGIRFVAFGSASTVANVTAATIANNVITNFPAANGILASGGNGNAGGAAGVFGTAGSGTSIIAITGNRIAGPSATNRIGAFGIAATVNGRGQGNFNVSNNGTVANPITNVNGQAITISSFGFANVTATVTSNVIVANNINAAPGIGAGTSQTFGAGDTPTLTVTITNNTISQTDGNGILVTARDATGVVFAKIQNNTVAAPLSGVRNGIRVDAGNAISVDDRMCLNISGNTTAGTGHTNAGIGLRKQGTVTTTNDFSINGMAATSSPGVEQFVGNGAGLNPGSENGTAGDGSVNGVILISATSGFSSCSLP